MHINASLRIYWLLCVYVEQSLGVAVQTMAGWCLVLASKKWHLLSMVIDTVYCKYEFKRKFFNTVLNYVLGF